MNLLNLAHAELRNKQNISISTLIYYVIMYYFFLLRRQVRWIEQQAA